MRRDVSRETRLLHVGQAPANLSRTVGPPIQKGSTVLLPDAASLYGDDQATYGRAGLGAQAALMEALADLERGTAVRLFPSGLAAMTGALLAVLKVGDDVLVTDAIYKPSRRFCDRVLRRFGVTVRYYPPRAGPEEILDLVHPNTRLIVMESPGSLTFEMQDVPAIAAAARARGILTLMDNTWAAGLYFQPLAHGVDLSVQALTKYVGGHSDVFMGSAAVGDPAMAAALDEAVLDFGWAVSPEDAYLMLRGLRTLSTRLAAHDQGGRRVATWLRTHPAVGKVLHPALPESQDHTLWRRDFSGAAGLFAFEIDLDRGPTAEAFLNALRLFGLGFSWGGFESLALNCNPQFSTRTHRVATSNEVIRLSVGLESPDDLIADLEQALQV